TVGSPDAAVAVCHGGGTRARSSQSQPARGQVLHALGGSTIGIVDVREVPRCGADEQSCRATPTPGGGMAQMLLREPQCRGLRIHRAIAHRRTDVAVTKTRGVGLPGQFVNSTSQSANATAPAREHVRLTAFPVHPGKCGERLRFAKYSEIVYT